MTKTPSSEEFNALLRTDFRTFLEKVFNTLEPEIAYQHNWHIDAIIGELEAMIVGETTRQIINLPPRHLKSMIASVALPMFLLGRNPGLKITCISYGEDLAREFSMMRRIIATSAWYQKAFHSMKIAKANDQELRTKAGGMVYTTSVGGALTGLGFHWMIIDDPIKADAANSYAERYATNQWFTNTAYSRLDHKETGRILVVMQRVHEEDLTGVLLESGHWAHLALPAIATEAEIIEWNGGSHERAENDALHPARESFESLMETREIIGSFRFQAQYQQNPVSPQGNIIRREWFKSYRGRPDLDFFEQIVQSWDCAAEIGQGNSYSVCITFGIIEGRAYVLDVFREQLKFPDLCRAVGRLARIKGAHRVYIETGGHGRAVMQVLDGKHNLNLMAVTPRGDKETRVARASATIEKRCIFLPEEAPWLGEFMHELMAFPHGKHDDQVDALSQFILAWQKMGPPQVHLKITSIHEGPVIIDHYAARMGGRSVF